MNEYFFLDSTEAWGKKKEITIDAEKKFCFSYIQKQTWLGHKYTMKFCYHSLLVVYLCLVIVVDDSNTLRIRSPAIRISSTFSKSESTKKKDSMNNRGIDIPAKTVPLKVAQIGKNDEF